MGAGSITTVIGVALSAVALSTVVVACSGTTRPAGEHPSTTPAADRASSPPSVSASSSATNFACTLDVATDAVTGAYGTASEIGWAGNSQGVVTCLGGWFYVQGRFNKPFGFGIYAGGPTTWADADGYLPAQITTFHGAGDDITITEFADQVLVGGHFYVAVYARVVGYQRRPTGRWSPTQTRHLAWLRWPPDRTNSDHTARRPTTTSWLSIASAASTPGRLHKAWSRRGASTSTSRTCVSSGMGS